MKKAVKILVVVVLAVVLALVLALAAHPLWVGPLVKTVAEKIGPKFTGTPIVMTNCVVNLYSGHFELGGFALSNPEGCAAKEAASVGSLKVDFDTLSALSNVINVRLIEVSGVFASYVKGASGKFNFTEIGDNVKLATGSSDSTAKQEAQKPEKNTSAGKKVIIERLSVGGVNLYVMGVKIPLLPGTIVLTDIGKKTNGATTEEAWTQVSAQVMNASGAAGKQLSALTDWGAEYGKKGLELGQKGYDAGKAGLQNALDAAKKIDVDGAKNALKDTGKKLESLGQGFKGLLKK